MLLSRVAENLYWAARYLERAEGTARVVREHTNLIVDMPSGVMSSWEPLLAITGTFDDYATRATDVSESEIVGYLIADQSNPSSIRSSVEHARANLRTGREVIPGPAWVAVNAMFLYVGAHDDEGVARQSRSRFLDRVVTSHQHLIGVLTSTMARDEAYTMLRLGRHIERADMATRIVDVWAATRLDDPQGTLSRYQHLQTASLLQAVSALEMYHRFADSDSDPAGPISFILDNADFPRSLRYCLDSAANSTRRLPNAAAIQRSVSTAAAALDGIDVFALDPPALHNAVDVLQSAIANIHEQIDLTYFRVG